MKEYLKKIIAGLGTVEGDGIQRPVPVQRLPPGHRHPLPLRATLRRHQRRQHVDDAHCNFIHEVGTSRTSLEIILERGLVKFVSALAYHSCLHKPAKFSQQRRSIISGLSMYDSLSNLILFS